MFEKFWSFNCLIILLLLTHTNFNLLFLLSFKLEASLEISVKEKDTVKVDQPLTLDPNVGGFGQEETEIVLQNPNRVKGMIVFFFTVTLTQILLVLKKKQFEKVQAAEMNF